MFHCEWLQLTRHKCRLVVTPLDYSLLNFLIIAKLSRLFFSIRTSCRSVFPTEPSFFIGTCLQDLYLRLKKKALKEVI